MTTMAQESSNAASAGLERQLVTFLLEDEEFAFDIMAVQEIIRPPRMAKVPRAAAHVEGIANLRGVVLPIMDLRARFGLPRSPDTDRTRVLVVDLDGTKTGLRVDRVKQVTRVESNAVEPPPPAIRSSVGACLEGVVKLEQGQRLIMTLDARHVCGGNAAPAADDPGGPAAAHSGPASQLSAGLSSGQGRAAAVRQLVGFKIASEEYAFAMERVREILRVEAPTEVPEAPPWLMGISSVRGQLLPVVDLRRLLGQPSLAEELTAAAGRLQTAWTGEDGLGHVELREWLANTKSSSRVLMDILGRLRRASERASRADAAERAAGAADVRAGLAEFAARALEGSREDQRIVVVDVDGLRLGLVVDHVSEVLQVPAESVDPPPVGGEGALALEGIVKLDGGRRLILLLEVAGLVQDRRLGQWRDETAASAAADNRQAADGDVHLVTFVLGDEEFGLPIARIQEIDRLARITRVATAAEHVEGVTNLRGEVVPVLDGRRRFGLPARPADDRTRIMILEQNGVKTGLVVDAVREVVRLRAADVAPPPEAIHAGAGQRFVAGIGKPAPDRMIVLLDVERVLAA